MRVRRNLPACVLPPPPRPRYNGPIDDLQTQGFALQLWGGGMGASGQVLEVSDTLSLRRSSMSKEVPHHKEEEWTDLSDLASILPDSAEMELVGRNLTNSAQHPSATTFHSSSLGVIFYPTFLLPRNLRVFGFHDLIQTARQILN